MIWEKFKYQFHESWHSKMRPFIESVECDQIYTFLKRETARGKKIAPLSNNVFRCFAETSLDDLKVVIVGLCPYHTFKFDQPVADGLLMGCSVTKQLQPSLDQFYNALETELYQGLNLHYTKNPDVSYLARQGVLMLNAALTTEKDKAGSHLKLWDPFQQYLFEKVLDVQGCPVIFLGKEAAKLERYVTPFTWVFRLSHPASAAYNGTDWESDGAFKSVNKILKERNNFTIDWLDVAPF